MPMVDNHNRKKIFGAPWRLCVCILAIGISTLVVGCQEAQPEIMFTPVFTPTVINAEPAAPVGYPADTIPTAASPPTLTPLPTMIPGNDMTPDAAESPQSSQPAAEADPAEVILAASPDAEAPTPDALEIDPPPTVESIPNNPAETPNPFVFSIGESLQGRPLTAYRFNGGPKKLIVVGGIHGGYEWNTILLAYKMLDHFIEHPEMIPDSITLIIIPSANPDGQALVTGTGERFTEADIAENTVPGRFNANNVDLNRNWACQWEPEATWRDQLVSGGLQPFSEPESRALRDYFLSEQPDAVIFLHSAANGIFAAGCPQTHLGSLELAQIYGSAAGYAVYEHFSSYPITGDAGDWLTLQGISNFTVELYDHQTLEWPKNLTGMLAILDFINNK